MAKQRTEVLIDKYGIGHAIAVRKSGMIEDLLIDQKNLDIFYPYNTIIYCTIKRPYKNRGGYFISLPNKKNGFLLTKKNYTAGQKVLVMAKGYQQEKDQQRFSDKIKMENDFFVLMYGKPQIYLSKKLKNAKKVVTLKEGIANILTDCKQNLTVIIRSRATTEDYENAITHFKKILSDFLGLKDTSSHQGSIIKLGRLCREIYFSDYHKKEFLLIEENDVFESMGIWDEINKMQAEKFYFGKNSYLILCQNAVTVFRCKIHI